MSPVPIEKPRLLLHVGTPKTGTTSLQRLLDGCHEPLKARGILYPRLYLSNKDVPKHQWLVKWLMARNEAGDHADWFDAVRAQVDGRIHTVILSTEGVFNHWWDFPEAARDRLHDLNRWFQVDVLVFFREPLSFAVSLYKQACCNPRTEIRCYGRDLSFDEMLLDPWFARHLDYASFIESCERLFGRDAVMAVKYEERDVIETFARIFGMEEFRAEATERNNASLGHLGVSLVRKMNRYRLPPTTKKRLVRLVRSLEHRLGLASWPIHVSETARIKVAELSGRSRQVLAARFGITWS